MAVIPGSTIEVPQGRVIGVSHALDSYGRMYRINPVGFMHDTEYRRDPEKEKMEWDFVVGNNVPLPDRAHVLLSEHGNVHGFFHRVDLSDETQRLMDPNLVYAVPRGWIDTKRAPRSDETI